MLSSRRNVGWYVWDHYIVYIGIQNGKMCFIANDMSGGVRLFDENEVDKLVTSFEPAQIRKFDGNYWDRQAALKRADGELGKKYHLLNFNCEHLANYIQYGMRISKQADNWLAGAAVIAFLFLVFGGSNR